MNNNYVIEDNLDFKAALSINDDDSVKVNTLNNTNVCLISGQELTKSFIKLPCSHTFNYISLLNEVKKQKQKTKNYFEVCILNTNQIKCPYCRTVIDNILPYIPSECDDKIYGVNSPNKYCLKNNILCEWVMKKKTGSEYSITCLKQGIYINDKSYCKLHYLKTKTKEKHDIEWTNDMKMAFKSNTLINLKQILKNNNIETGGNKKELIERLYNNNINITDVSSTK